MKQQRLFRRWDKSQIRQHQVTMISCLLLIATGLPLMFAHTKASQTLAQYLGGATTAALVHRIAAVALIFVSLWHPWYLFRRWRQGALSTAMFPSRKDLADVLHQLRYLVGREAHEARWARYNFIEKFEYWAMVWGTLVMIVTGLILWFPVTSARLVTATGLELATVIHSYEALLASLSILFWHMYHAHLRRDVFPMNRLWLTGTLNEEEMRHHHPAELDAILAAEAADLAAPEPLPAESIAGDDDVIPTESADTFPVDPAPGLDRDELPPGADGGGAPDDE